MTDHKDVPGFFIPFRRSLMQVMLMAGLPRTLAFMIWTTAGALGLGMRQWWVVPVAVIIHIGVAMLTKKEPYFFEIFIRAIKAPDKLQP